MRLTKIWTVGCGEILIRYWFIYRHYHLVVRIRIPGGNWAVRCKVILYTNGPGSMGIGFLLRKASGSKTKVYHDCKGVIKTFHFVGLKFSQCVGSEWLSGGRANARRDCTVIKFHFHYNYNRYFH